MTSKRLVSVIIGTRNRPDLLREALQSIRALEGPDLTFEILVGDNGTTPETEAVVAEFGGIYDKTDVYGCPAARNLAMRRMTGEFVGFLDDDDVWLPGNIRPHIALMDANPELVAVHGQIQVCDQDLRPIAQPWPSEWPKNNDVFLKMMGGYFPQVGGTLVRGDVARKVGLMDEGLIGDSDWDWQLRFASSHQIGFVQVPSVLCRARPAGSFDKLQTTRIGYTRKIFFRHASKNLGRWRSPLGLVRSYFGATESYYNYFVEVAGARASAGDRKGALEAVVSALRVYPSRAVRALLSSSSELSEAARTAFQSRRASPRALEADHADAG